MYHGYVESKAVNQDDKLKVLEEEMNVLREEMTALKTLLNQIVSRYIISVWVQLFGQISTIFNIIICLT